MPEVWGGMECTVNRIGDRYHDQVARSGHGARLADIDRFADLGITTLRYPVLWERLAPLEGVTPAWERVEGHLLRMQERGIAPIAGLVHHGSGPPHTSLLDPRFGERLAAYARLVAERYPWITRWTPVNEPLSTARFSGLYGHWYPHRADDESFVRVLVNELRATVLAMRAIREVIPDAAYFHTDDVGVITSTPRLEYQAAFENHRQLLAIDLLARRVDARHPLRRYLRRWGMTEHELAWFEEFGIAPDVIGADHYVTSDRFLDDRVVQYPGVPVGGNGRDRYVDVATADLPGWSAGFEEAIRRLWARYRIPVALGEVHLNAPREAQLEWLLAAWRGARAAEADGIPVPGVCSWALLGSFDWDSLVRVDRGHYEVGAFDLRGHEPRPTAIAHALRALARTGTYEHPVLAGQAHAGETAEGAPAVHTGARQPLLVLGASGTLGREFLRRCEVRGIHAVAARRHDADVTNAASVSTLVDATRPWAVINATGFVSVDTAELDPESCRAVNVTGAVNVAEACERFGARYATFSSDLVFDGEKGAPYLEHDATEPLNVYGRSKRDAEIAVHAAMPSGLVVRTSAFFGARDDHNFVVRTLRQLAEGRPLPASAAVVSPTSVEALADAVLDLLIDDMTGLWHLSSSVGVSWADLARQVAVLAGHDASLVYEAPPDVLGWRGTRPEYSALGSARGRVMPDFNQSLEGCVADVLRAAS